jgi:hypothetical protein
VSAEVDAFAAYLATLEPDKQKQAFTQARLLSANQTPQEVFEPPIRTLGQYLADDIEVPPVLVDPFLVVRGGVDGLIGRAGKGKTVFALNRMMRWSAGSPLFADWKDKDGNHYMKPSGPLKCLVIENEGAGGLFHRQVGIMLNAEGYLTDEERDLVRENMLVWGDGGYSGLKLDDPAKLKMVRDGCEKWEPDIVFIEPFRGLWNGEENSATDMAVVVDAMVEIAADYKCGVMVSHHERKSGAGEDGEKMSAGRGSTVLEGAVTVMENFEAVKGGEFREVTCSKSRHGTAYNPVRMQWDPEAWWYKHVPTSAVDEAILSAIMTSPEPMSVADLADATDEKKDPLRKAAERLVKEGRLKKMASVSDGRGSTGARYRLPEGENSVSRGLAV